MDGSLIVMLANGGAGLTVAIATWRLGQTMDRANERIDAILKGGKLDGGKETDN